MAAQTKKDPAAGKPRILVRGAVYEGRRLLLLPCLPFRTTILCGLLARQDGRDLPAPRRRTDTGSKYAKVFATRRKANEELATKLAKYANRPDVFVLALPRGGVRVVYEVARALRAPLDVLVVRKLWRART